MTEPCVFCAIANKTMAASIVFEDAATLAFVDLRQFHPGHTLVIPRQHIHDMRDCDDATGAALIATLIRVTRAVDAAFPGDGLSIWHSIGPAAHQEVPHLHLHIHPRKHADDLLRVYPAPPNTPDRAILEQWAAQIRAHL
jgi:histidine triad (HIT) family protein